MDVGLQVEWVLDEINHGSRGDTADRVQEGSGRTRTPKAVLVQTEPEFSSFQKVLLAQEDPQSSQASTQYLSIGFDLRAVPPPHCKCCQSCCSCLHKYL